MQAAIHDALEEHFSTADLFAVTGDDCGMRRGLRDILIEEAPRQLAHIEDACASGNARETADAAHALKSLVATVGGRRAFALADDLERSAKSGTLPDCAPLLAALAASLLHLSTALSAFVDGETDPC